MPNYSEGKIYKVWAKDECYIGSTVQTLPKRFHSHKKDKDTTVKNLFDKYGVENCKIELLELFPCGSKLELLKREAEWILKTECVNRNVAGRTPNESCKAWYEKNKDKKKAYREANKERNKEYHKAYREAHRDKMVVYLRDYYQKKKETKKDNSK